MYRVSRDKPHRKRSEEMKEKYPVPGGLDAYFYLRHLP